MRYIESFATLPYSALLKCAGYLSPGLSFVMKLMTEMFIIFMHNKILVNVLLSVPDVLGFVVLVGFSIVSVQVLIYLGGYCI